MTLLYSYSFVILNRQHVQVEGITALCHFRKHDIMAVICKNDKHLLTLYNVISSNMTGILSHLSYIFFLIQDGSNVQLK